MKKIIYAIVASSLLIFSCTKTETIEKKDIIEPINPKTINVEEVKLDNTTLSLNVGDVANLKASILPENANNKNLIWSTSNKEILSLEYGEIKAIKEGNAIITVTSIDGNKTAKCELTISQQKLEIKKIQIKESNLSINVGKTYQLHYSISPANAENSNLLWSSDNEAIASVQNGIVSAKSVGNVNINLTTSDGKVSAICAIIVCAPDRFGSFTDERDKKVYKTVIIGKQVWLAENLAYLPSVNRFKEGSKNSAYYYVYAYDGSNTSQAKQTESYKTHGVLYNWEAAKTACPKGWHLASDEEWKELEMEIGMSKEDADKYGERSNIAPKLKSKGAWTGNNITNESGFTALASGELYYYNEDGENGSEFMSKGRQTKYWTSSLDNDDKAFFRFLSDSDVVYRRKTDKDQAFSVRCIKDKE